MRYLPALGLLALLLLDLLVGGGTVSMATGAVLWKLRVPRVLTAVIAGGALAASGAQMQAVFRNPLADPHIMGVSGGAGRGGIGKVPVGDDTPGVRGDAGVHLQRFEFRFAIYGRRGESEAVLQLDGGEFLRQPVF